MNKTTAEAFAKVLLIVMLIFPHTLYNRGLSEDVAALKIDIDTMIESYEYIIDKQQKEIDTLKEELHQEVMMPVNNTMSFKAEVTYYSKDEKTDTPGYEDKNCIGGKLKKGDWAAPDFIPLHSLLEVTYEDGTKETAYIIDRGSTNVIKIFDRNQPPRLKGAAMRLDKYVQPGELKGKGLDLADVKIIRWGK